jgi:hypothetical protein
LVFTLWALAPVFGLWSSVKIQFSSLCGSRQPPFPRPQVRRQFFLGLALSCCPRVNFPLPLTILGPSYGFGASFLFLQILPGARQGRRVVPAQLGHRVRISCTDLFGCRSRTRPIFLFPVVAPVPADWCCSVLDFRFGGNVFFGSRFLAPAPAREYPSCTAECAPRGLAPCSIFVASPSLGARQKFHGARFVVFAWGCRRRWNQFLRQLVFSVRSVFKSSAVQTAGFRLEYWFMVAKQILCFHFRCTGAHRSCF